MANAHKKSGADPPPERPRKTKMFIKIITADFAFFEIGRTHPPLKYV